MMVVTEADEGSYKVGCFPVALEDDGTRARIDDEEVLLGSGVW